MCETHEIEISDCAEGLYNTALDRLLPRKDHAHCLAAEEKPLKIQRLPSGLRWGKAFECEAATFLVIYRIINSEEVHRIKLPVTICVSDAYERAKCCIMHGGYPRTVASKCLRAMLTTVVEEQLFQTNEAVKSNYEAIGASSFAETESS